MSEGFWESVTVGCQQFALINVEHMILTVSDILENILCKYSETLKCVNSLKIKFGPSCSP